MNRKLIRPNLSQIKQQISQDKDKEREPSKKKSHPPTDTHAESYYYLKQMNKKVPMSVVFTNGDTVEGIIEWYDRNCIKLNRDDAPNLLIYKHSIRYLCKLNENEEPPEEKPKPKKK